MPSPLHVPVATISAITPHSNADTLEIAHVLGWQCVVKRGQFSVGDRVVYFAPDVVLPQETSDLFGVTSYLDRGRIRATRLRGEPSFGLVIKPADESWEVGQNVADYYGATKWEPPTREQRGQGKYIANPDAVPRNPMFCEYTHIANLRHYPDLIGDDELVVVTEKLHGTNSRIGIVDSEWLAGSHRVQRGQADEVYWSPRKHAEGLVSALAKYHKQVILYGEILGSSVQSLDYGYEGYAGYRAFDLMVDGRYVDYSVFYDLCALYHVKTVPVLSYGHRFDFNVIKDLAQGHTTLYIPLYGGDHLREGVVVKPLVERTDRHQGRVILKFVSDDFLIATGKKKVSDFAEV